ncbi:TolC family protein [Sunxiuqinia elliptica]|uniref:Outer membrane protein TolC n=1 Tax=Sunxiuqinia elliptica TaxID=655355 RepID=A0A4R6H6I0_9BACT|nr:TolC family protein [Sunxiuqinia elliptica]TDO03943.1 outer membrane protein TolC [Sunxiuqinia elliptica]TDO62225.1 outer membrane protein TolC [Sunxiuqinia elliptica]
MMKPRVFWCFVFMACLVQLKSYAQTSNAKVLTFSEVYDQMMGNSHVLKQAEYQMNEKAAELKAAKGLRAPKVSLTGTAVQMADPLHLDLTPVRDAITPLYSALGHFGNFSGVPNPDPGTNQLMPTLPDDMSTAAMRAKLLEGLDHVNAAEWDQMIQEKQFASLSASVVWPLFTGGKINAANEAARIHEEEAGLQKEQKQAELLSELVTRYYGLVLSREAEKVREQVLDAMEKHLYDAEKLTEEGQIAQVEKLHAEVAKADAERELQKARRQSQIVERSLQNTLAMEPTESIVPANRLFILSEVGEESQFVELAKTNSPLLKQVDSKKELSKTGVKLEKSDYMPTVALTGMYDIANKDLSPYVPEWLVGVGVKWTLFDGAARTRKVQAAKHRVSQVEEAGLKAEDDIETVIRKLHQQLSMQLEQHESLKKSLTFAEAYLESKDRAFHEGLATSSDVVDARLLVAKFKIEQLQAMYQYDVALASLMQICGVPAQFNNYLTSDLVITQSID